MSWKTFQNRGEVLRTVIATADARRDGSLPLDVDGVAETFGDAMTLLGALQLRWHTRLAGRIEQVHALVAARVVMPRHEGVEAIARDVDVTDLLVIRQRVERQVGL